MNINLKKKTGESISLTHIEESGSRYIKFNDGTMICYGQVGYIDYAAERHNTITFPRPFINIPAITITPYAVYVPNDPRFCPTYSSAHSYIHDETNTGFISECCYCAKNAWIAIGRWK